MARTNQGAAPGEIRKVQERFEGWRAHKRGRERIPASLWSAAAQLCATHSVYHVARWLRLNPTALRDRTKATGLHGSRRSPTFVEWASPAVPPPTASSTEYLLEIERAGERTLRVRARGVTIAEVAALARALRQEEREG